MDFKILPMAEKHIVKIAELERECFSTPWSETALLEELSNPQAHFLCAVCNDTVAGYIGVQEIVGEAYITNIAVFSDFRRKGIADRLLLSAQMDATERECDFITLEVRKSNEAAISLYKKHGFAIAGERKKFYTAPSEDALIMTKNLRKEEL